jgi:DNA-directed RNA polymerase subunit alpha
MEYHITLPSKPRVVSEEGMLGIYEIDSLYPGYGQTLGNSLRRIIFSSLPGAAITSVKIDDVQHEFATIEGIRESVMEILLNLKRVHFTLHGDEAQTIRLSIKGPKQVTAADFQTPSQLLQTLTSTLLTSQERLASSLKLQSNAVSAMYLAKFLTRKRLISAL